MLSRSQNADVPCAGREDEFARLSDVIQRVNRGKGGVVMVTGEMGIGKTSLIQTALSHVGGQIGVIRSTAYPFAQDLAYALIVHGLDEYIEKIKPERIQQLMSNFPQILYVSRLLHSLPTTNDTAVQSAFDKTHLFEGIVSLLQRFCVDGPIVWFLDDAHWADTSSIQMLEYLIRRLESSPVLFILSYRSDEFFYARSLRSLIVSISPTFVLDEIKLERLGREDTINVIRERLGENIGLDVFEFIYERSGGTPLFIIMVLETLLQQHLLVDVDGVFTFTCETKPSFVPDRIRDLVQSKMDSLTKDQQAILYFLAVFGQSISFKMLWDAVKLPEDSVVSALVYLINTNIVMEITPGNEVRYWFFHPMIQEAIYDSIPLLLRTSFHRNAFNLLKFHNPNDLLSLTAHAREALPDLDIEESMPLFLSAIDQLFQIGAYEEAARDISAVLYFVRRGYRRELLPRLLEQLGLAWHLCGEQAAGHDILQEARDAYAVMGSPQDVARIECHLALCSYRNGNVHEALSHVNQGIDKLVGCTVSEELLRLHSIRVSLLVRGFADLNQFIPSIHELIEIASKVGTERAKTLSMGLRAIIMYCTKSNPEDHLEFLNLGMDSVEVLQDSHEIIDFCVIKLLYHLEFGEQVQAMQWGRKSIEYATTPGIGTAEQPAYPFVVLSDYLAGNWDAALRVSDEALERHANGAARWSSLGLRALILTKTGYTVRARACIQEARNARKQLLVEDETSTIIEADIVDFMLRDNPLSAEEKRSLEQVVSGGNWRILPGLWVALLAEILMNCQLVSSAMDVATLLYSRAQSGFPLSQALGDRITGLHLFHVGQYEEAMRLLLKNAESFQKLGMPYEAHRDLSLWCSIAVQQSRYRREVIPVANKCLEFFEQMDARSDAERMRTYLSHFQISGNTQKKRDRQTLSSRESEIAGLVARGLSNAEIAKQLFISVRTVTTHLERIYERTGLHNRTSLTRFVVESGMLSSKNT